jgi:[acyl-carrier-protein] S-malonyltransferase
VYAAVTADVAVDPAEVAAYRASTGAPVRPEPAWRLSIGGGDFVAHPDTLPLSLAEALRASGPGRTVTVGGRSVTFLRTVPTAGEPADASGALLDAARRLAFVRWLDHARAYRLRLVPGLEHPGDPRQPDNHHRH